MDAHLRAHAIAMLPELTVDTSCHSCHTAEDLKVLKKGRKGDPRTWDRDGRARLTDGSDGQEVHWMHKGRCEEDKGEERALCTARKKRAWNELATGMVHGADPTQLEWSDVKRFEPMARGANSVVHMGVLRSTGKAVALKETRENESSDANVGVEEIQALEAARGRPGLVQYYGWYRSPESGKQVLVMEYMSGGDLAALKKKKGRIPLQQLASVTKDVLEGLHSMHAEMGVVHRDVKPGNILLDHAGRAKLGDFGLATAVSSTGSPGETTVGTMVYMPPEYLEHGTHNANADIWSLGISVLECATGLCPYRSNGSPMSVMVDILSEPTPTVPKCFPADFRDFVSVALDRDISRRPSAQKLLKHPFMMGPRVPVTLESHRLGTQTFKARLWELARAFVARHYTLRDQLGCCTTCSEALHRSYRAVSTGQVSSRKCHGPAAIVSELQHWVRLQASRQTLHHEVVGLEVRMAHGDRATGTSEHPLLRVTLHVVLLRPFDPFGGPPARTLQEELFVALTHQRERLWIRHHSSTLSI